jgi:hypothetical protein
VGIRGRPGGGAVVTADAAPEIADEPTACARCAETLARAEAAEERVRELEARLDEIEGPDSYGRPERPQLRAEPMAPAQFVDKFNAAPWDEERLAEAAAKVSGTVGEKARAYLRARAEFEAALDAIGYERG